MNKPQTVPWILFAATVSLSAFLLFQVQPLIGKTVLPWFGGTPAVWTTCMLVFQMLLFGGYLYAHLTSRYLNSGQQALLHGLLLLVAAGCLPISPDPAWKPVGGESPVLRIMLLLLSTVGLPYFLLSSTGPLVQHWLSQARPGESPYRLYSLSNAGSLLALISYPFVVEPTLSTTTQSWIWSLLFVGFGVSCLATAMLTWRAAPASHRSAASVESTTSSAPCAEAPNLGRWGTWFGLAMLPSVMLLATTNQVCLDVAVVPFLWIIPLTIYLLTFILCFDSDRWYSRRIYMMLAACTMAGSCVLIMRGADGTLLVQAGTYFAALFFVCMVAHGELVQLKPHPRYLTAYYLTMSAGGAAGGLFVGLIAPAIFSGYFELQCAILCATLMCLGYYLHDERWWRERVPAIAKLGGAVAIVVSSMLILTSSAATVEGGIESSRNFYGVLRIAEKRHPATGEPVRQMLHGRIVHGLQFLVPGKEQTPTSYYSKRSGVGQWLTGISADQPVRVGVVGLGVGTLAAYGREGDEYTFYEINPDVISLARKHFTFLEDSKATISMELGDARLLLEREAPRQFDLLVLDAFSGDAIPVHLLTREVVETYLRHLANEGTLAVHISNLHFDLRPVLAGISREFHLSGVVVSSSPDAETGGEAARWCLLSRDATRLEEFHGEPIQAPDRKSILWTDDWSNLFEVLQ